MKLLKSWTPYCSKFHLIKETSELMWELEQSLNYARVESESQTQQIHFSRGFYRKHPGEHEYEVANLSQRHGREAQLCSIECQTGPSEKRYVC